MQYLERGEFYRKAPECPFSWSYLSCNSARANYLSFCLEWDHFDQEECLNAEKAFEQALKNAGYIPTEPKQEPNPKNSVTACQTITTVWKDEKARMRNGCS